MSPHKKGKITQIIMIKGNYRLSFVALAFILTSCVSSGNSLPLSIFQGMVTCRSGALVSDDGDRYSLMNPDTGCALDSGRFMAICEVWRKTAEHQYEARLVDITKAEGPKILKMSETEAEALEKDPLDVVDIWVSGDYINMQNQCITLKGSPTGHLVNLVFDDTASRGDTLFFSMCHNSFGEKPDNPQHKSKTFMVTTYFSSYSLEGTVPRSNSKKVICLKWRKYSDFKKFNVEEHSVSHICEY